MQKVRKGHIVWSRKTDADDWEEKVFMSISQAKKANGLNSRTVAKAPANPVREEVAA